MGRARLAAYGSGVTTRTAFQASLGRRIYDLRADAGLTQEKLAERTSLSAKYLSDIELGKVNPSVGVLYDIATAGFEIPLQTMLNFSLDVDEHRKLHDALQALLEGQTADGRRRALAALAAFFGPVGGDTDRVDMVSPGPHRQRSA